MKKSSKVCFGIGCFCLFGSLATLGTDISIAVGYLFFSVIFFWFGRAVIKAFIHKRKNNDLPSNDIEEGKETQQANIRLTANSGLFRKEEDIREDKSKEVLTLEHTIYEIDEEVIETAKQKLINYKAISILTLSQELKISIEEAEQVIKTLILDGVIEIESTYSGDVIGNIVKSEMKNNGYENLDENDYDIDLFLEEAINVVVESGQASTSFIQRRFKVGYARAQRIIDQMEARGIISGYNGSIPRKVLITKEQLQELKIVIDEPESIKEKNKKDIDVYKLYKLDEIYIQGYRDVNINLVKNVFVERMDEETYEELINTFVIHSNPEELKVVIINIGFLKIDKIFNGKRQLLIPVITDVNKIEAVISWALNEMVNRYNLLTAGGVRDIENYNKRTEKEKLPKILITIDDYSIVKIYSSSLAIVNEYIQEMFVKGEKVGIYLIVGSKYKVEDTGIGNISRYCKVINDRELNNIIKLESKGLSNSNTNINDKGFIDEIDNCNGLEFENYAKQILINNNFDDVEVTKSSGDQGADVIAYKDGIKYAIQCKKFSQPVGNSAVQEVIGSKSIYNCHVAVVMTNNYFTKSAKELAEKNKVLLWDRDVLIDLLKK